MTNAKIWAKREIERDTDTIQELRNLRRMAFEDGDRKKYDRYTRDIRELNENIKGLKESYGIE